MFGALSTTDFLTKIAEKEGLEYIRFAFLSLLFSIVTERSNPPELKVEVVKLIIIAVEFKREICGTPCDTFTIQRLVKRLATVSDKEVNSEAGMSS